MCTEYKWNIVEYLDAGGFKNPLMLLKKTDRHAMLRQGHTRHLKEFFFLTRMTKPGHRARFMCNLKRGSREISLEGSGPLELSHTELATLV